MKTYVVDIDGCICHGPEGRYDDALPDRPVIDRINTLYEQGNTIVFFTARGATTGIDWKGVTEKQLFKWGVKYHRLIMGKPHGDLFIDDKAVNIRDWMLLSSNKKDSVKED